MIKGYRVGDNGNGRELNKGDNKARNGRIEQE